MKPNSHTVKSSLNGKTEELTLKEKILYSVLGVLVIGGTVYFGRKLVLDAIANKEEKKSYQEGEPATYAKQIKLAFENDGWFGTDMEALRSTIRQIASKEDFAKVIQSYKVQFQSNLVADLSNELQTTEYNEIIQIIAAKPEKKGQTIPTSIYNYDAWAKRLKAAFDKSYGFFPGTDNDAIRAVFNEIPSQSVFVQVAVAYQKLYGKILLNELQSELEPWEFPSFIALITSKPKT